MLHHRLPRLRVWSANISVQPCPSHALTSAKFSSHTNFANASPIGSSKDSGDRHRRFTRSSRRPPSPLRSTCYPAECFIALQKPIQGGELADCPGRKRAAHVLAHKASEPLAQRARFAGDFVEFSQRGSLSRRIQRLLRNKVRFSEPHGEAFAAIEPVNGPIDRRGDGVEEIEAGRVGDEECRRSVRRDGLSNYGVRAQIDI